MTAHASIRCWELGWKNPPADSTTSAPQRFTETENAVIEELMVVILQHGLSGDQAKALLGRIIQLLEWGKLAAHKMPEANA